MDEYECEATYTTRERIYSTIGPNSRVRMPFSSQEGYKFKLYNQEYQYNQRFVIH